MPTLLNRSMEDMLAAMAGAAGTSWPNPWWPKGLSSYDDCAACLSYYLFGLNSSGNPFYSYVSQLQTFFAGQGRRMWGHAGIQRGDVLAFSWTQDPNSFDHTEIALGPVSPAGLITSRGTNSNPGDDMRDRTRSAAYVVSYSRPAYPGTTATAGSGAQAITPAAPPAPPVKQPQPQEDDMYIKATTPGPSGDARQGFIYRRVDGSWMAVASLEGSTIAHAIRKDKPELAFDFTGPDLEVLFATDGLWEQLPLDGKAQTSIGALQGLGARTGRRIYRGSPGALGKWHYPHLLGTANPAGTQ